MRILCIDYYGVSICSEAMKSRDKKYAYVTFIVINDSFLPGAIMFAYGIKQQGSNIDTVCLVSEKISKNAITTLRMVFDKVIRADELYIKHKQSHQRQDRSFLFSRFNALRLGRDGDLKQSYTKIVLCDSDVFPVKNYDYLFELNTPAGIINENKDNCIMHNDDGEYIRDDSVCSKGEWHWHEIYREYPHGSFIPKQVTDKIIKDVTNLGVNSSLWVLSPSYSEYMDILDNLKCICMQNFISRLKWPEMQYATIRWSGNWTNVDLRYSSFNGYPELSILYGLHYAGTKPWRYRNIKHLEHIYKYPDYRYWYESYIFMMNSYNNLFDNYKLKKLYIDIVQVMGAQY